MRFILATVFLVASACAAPVAPSGKITVDMLTKMIDLTLASNNAVLVSKHRFFDLPPEIRSLLPNLDATDKQQLVDLINGFAESQIDPPKTLDGFIQLLIQKVPKVGNVIKQLNDQQEAEIAALNNADVTAFNNQWKDAFFAVSDRNVTVWQRNLVVLAPKFLTALQQLAANQPAWNALCSLSDVKENCADYAEHKDKLDGFIQILNNIPADFQMTPEAMEKMFAGAHTH